MILTGIKLHYRLKVPKEKRATVERALEHHEGLCAASESVRRGITVEWDSEIVEEADAEAGKIQRRQRAREVRISALPEKIKSTSSP